MAATVARKGSHPARKRALRPRPHPAQRGTRGPPHRRPPRSHAHHPRQARAADRRYQPARQPQSRDRDLPGRGPAKRLTLQIELGARQTSSGRPGPHPAGLLERAPQCREIHADAQAPSPITHGQRRGDHYVWIRVGADTGIGFTTEQGGPHFPSLRTGQPHNHASIRRAGPGTGHHALDHDRPRRQRSRRRAPAPGQRRHLHAAAFPPGQAAAAEGRAKSPAARPRPRRPEHPARGRPQGHAALHPAPAGSFPPPRYRRLQWAEGPGIRGNLPLRPGDQRSRSARPHRQ